MLTKSCSFSGFHSMKNPLKKSLKIMTKIIQKLRRKRKLSSEFDSRWGDAAISSPNDGSWSQHDRPSCGVHAVPSCHAPEHGHDRNKAPLGLFEHHRGLVPPPAVQPPSQHIGVNSSTTDSPLSVPTGYYNANVRSRVKKKPFLPELTAPSHEQTTATLPKAWENGDFGDSSADEGEHDDVSALGVTKARWPDESDVLSRISKSPPLSVTSRMRRYSGQSSATDPTFSIPATASSKRTSFTSSLPEDPRLVRNSPYHEKISPRQPNVHNTIPAPQELVPSYDDLYG